MREEMDSLCKSPLFMASAIVLHFMLSFPWGLYSGHEC